MNSKLPAVDSVWGMVDGVKTWRRFCGVDDDRGYHWETWRGEFFEAELRLESGAVDIKAIVSRMQQFDSAVQSANVDAKAMQLLSQFGNDVVASMSLAGQYNLKDLAYAAVLVSDHYYQQTMADNSQPFTVEWLCEIGFTLIDESWYAIGEVVDDVSLFEYDASDGEWYHLGHQLLPRCFPKTRGDVLAWLNVLGIVPKLTPKQAAKKLAEQFTRDGQMGGST